MRTLSALLIATVLAGLVLAENSLNLKSEHWYLRSSTHH